MGNEVRALLVGGVADDFGPLQKVLTELGIRSEFVRSLSEAKELIDTGKNSELIFLQSTVAGGLAPALIQKAAAALKPTRVIVLADSLGYDDYLDLMDAGAADFLMPPFTVEDVRWLVTSVIGNGLRLGMEIAS